MVNIKQQCPKHLNIGKLIGDRAKRGRGGNKIQGIQTVLSKGSKIVEFKTYKEAAEYLDSSADAMRKYLKRNDTYKGWTVTVKGE